MFFSIFAHLYLRLKARRLDFLGFNRVYGCGGTFLHRECYILVKKSSANNRLEFF